MKRLQIIDSTTITLFSNFLFKGVGRHPRTGKKKGGIKVHTVIHANEGVPSDIKFTSAATNDSFMLRPSVLNKGDIIAMDRAYIDYEKLETLTQKAQTGFIAYKRYGIRTERDYRNLPQTLGDRTALQADKTEFSLEILLWGKCKCD